MLRIIWLLSVSAAACFAQAAIEANQPYTDPATRLKIAAGMVEETRDARQKPADLVARLEIRKGMSVADVGTASGYMLPFLAAAVGPQGRVWAEDIYPDFLAAAKKRAAECSNITWVLGTEKSAELPAQSVDLALILDTYHHFNYPEAMMTSLKKALKPGGRVAVVEYHKTETSMPNRHALKHIRLTREEFVREIESFGFRTVSVSEFLPGIQWLGLFEAQ